jgi:hypothetical protein
MHAYAGVVILSIVIFIFNRRREASDRAFFVNLDEQRKTRINRSREAMRELDAQQ